METRENARYAAVKGVSWGVICIGILSICGWRVAADTQEEKYYLIVGMPHLVLNYLGILVNHYVKKVLFLLLFRWRLPFSVIGRFALVVSPETP